MPAIVSGLVDGLHFGAREAGWVGSANVYGAVVGALLAVFLSQRLPWRRLAVIALCALIAIDLLSVAVVTPWPLIGTRFAHGVVGGTLVGTAFAVIARTSVPERTFGMLLIVQYGLGGVALLLLPRLIPVFGSQLLFLVLAAFSVVTLAMLPFLAAYPRRPVPTNVPAATEAAARRRGALLILALFAVFFFQCGNMALSAYVIELGRAYGLGLNGISAILGVAGWLGALGAVLVILLKLKAGRCARSWRGSPCAVPACSPFTTVPRPWCSQPPTSSPPSPGRSASRICWACVLPSTAADVRPPSPACSPSSAWRAGRWWRVPSCVRAIGRCS